MAASLAQAGHDQPRREGYVIEAVIAGVLAGYAIAIPVGAIAVLIIHVAIQDGVRAGLAAGAGAASADGIYALVAVVAGVAAAQFLGELQDPLRLIGGAVLLGIGLRGLTALRSPREAAPAPVLRAGRNRRTFLVVLGLTLLNPVTVVYFAALVMGLPPMAGPSEQAAFVVAVFLSSLSWQSLLAMLGSLLGRGSSAQRLRRPTTAIGSIVIIGFGVFIVWQALA
jgi:threonine/homoserine/homoserine lactone efflux protein